jgi:PIN domain nuclease of toxin-antitoxin system
MGRAEQSPLVHLDTHVVIWLYEGRIEELSRPASDLIEAGRCAISPMVRLELQYLFEIGRNEQDADFVLAALRQLMALEISGTALNDVVQTSLKINWTRDVFDRLIVAHAMHEQVPLVTRDRRIRDNFSWAKW